MMFRERSESAKPRSRISEALAHIEVSDLPPPPYRDVAEIVEGSRVELRVQFEDCSRPGGVVQKLELANRAGRYVMMVMIKFDDDDYSVNVRAEWIM